MTRILKYFSLLFILLLGACGNEIRYDMLDHDAVILAFGDSVTYGYNASDKADYPTKLAQLIDRTVINAGISGERVSEGQYRINGLLTEHRPDLVIIEIGGNDFIAGRNNQTIKEEIRRVIQAVKGADAIPLLVAVPNRTPAVVVTGRFSDAPLYAELAKEESIPLLPEVFSNILSDESLRSDQIHPNDRGYQQLADALADYLRELGLI